MRICSRSECEAPAAWQVVLLLYLEDEEGDPARGELGLFVCGAHAGEVELEEVIGDDGKRAVEEGLANAGRPLPDWPRCRVELVAAGDVGPSFTERLEEFLARPAQAALAMDSAADRRAMAVNISAWLYEQAGGSR